MTTTQDQQSRARLLKALSDLLDESTAALTDVTTATERTVEVWNEAHDAMEAARALPEPENVREGDPYDNPAFEDLARTMGVWSTAQAALCAQFFLAGRGAVPAGIKPVGYLIDWPDEPDLGHYFAEGASTTGRSQPLHTAAQVLTMGRVPVDAEAAEMARAVHKKLKALRKKDVSMDAYVLLTDAQYVIERLTAAAPRPPAVQHTNLSNSEELARNPLTDEQIDAILISAAKYGLFLKKDEKGQWFKRQEVIDACRAVEVMHGITHPTGD